MKIPYSAGISPALEYYTRGPLPFHSRSSISFGVHYSVSLKHEGFPRDLLARNRFARTSRCLLACESFPRELLACNRFAGTRVFLRSSLEGESSLIILHALKWYVHALQLRTLTSICLESIMFPLHDTLIIMAF